MEKINFFYDVKIYFSISIFLTHNKYRQHKKLYFFYDSCITVADKKKHTKIS